MKTVDEIVCDVPATINNIECENEEEFECGKPCDPNYACDECAEYQR